MLNREELEKYRKMTVAEKFRLTCELTEKALEKMLEGPPEVVGRRFEELRRENDARNKNMLEGIARTRKAPDDSADRCDVCGHRSCDEGGNY